MSSCALLHFLAISSDVQLLTYSNSSVAHCIMVLYLRGDLIVVENKMDVVTR
jgi:hypothetical protein